MSELPLWGLKEEVPCNKKVNGETRVGVGWGGGQVTPHIGYTDRAVQTG